MLLLELGFGVWAIAETTEAATIAKLTITAFIGNTFLLGKNRPLGKTHNCTNCSRWIEKSKWTHSKQVAGSRRKKEPGILPGSTGLYLLMRSHLPIVGSAVIFVPLRLPIAILPGVIAELWGVFQHLLTDVGPEAVE